MNEPFDKLAALYVDLVTRLEIIDYTPCVHCKGSRKLKSIIPGREIECRACDGKGVSGRTILLQDPTKQIELSLQDDERTLKIFINERV